MPRIDEVKLFYVIWGLLFVLNFLVLAFSPLTLSVDEAHYWEWSRHPALAYYSKGPLVAMLITVSKSALGNSAFAVRFPALLCYTAFSLLFFHFASQLYGSRRALFLWLVLSTMVIFSHMALLMTTDAPAALCWLLALVFAYRAIFEERQSSWLPFGAAVGLGIWAKYTVLILYPCLGLFFLISPNHRKGFYSGWFAGGAAISFLLILPILLWNASHDWLNFEHNASHVLHGRQFSFTPRHLIELILGQAGLAGPVVFVSLVIAFWHAMRKRTDDIANFFFAMGAPVFLLMILVSCTKAVYANWPMPLYIGGLLCVMQVMVAESESFKAAHRWYRFSLCVNTLFTLFAYGLYLGCTYGLPTRLLPTKKLVGWDVLGRKVEEAWQQEGRENTVLVSSYYGFASAISFYAPSHPFVYCARLGDRRPNQYSVWTAEADWALLKGKRLLLVLREGEAIGRVEEKFAHIRALSSTPDVSLEFAGSRTYGFRFYLGEEFDGTPLS